MAKIAAVLPSSSRLHAETSALLIGPAAHDGDRERLYTVRTAIRGERKLDVAYRDLAMRDTRRKIWPFALGFFDRAQVVVGFCELRQAMRHFRLDRILSASDTGERYPRRRHDLMKEVARERTGAMDVDSLDGKLTGGPPDNGMHTGRGSRGPVQPPKEIVMSEASFVILYVDNPARSAAFYESLLERAPIEASPTFAMFALREGMMLGLWSRHTVEPAAAAAGGGAEIAFTVSGAADVDEAHATWRGKGLAIAQAPTDLDFGRTFVALDPDGHRLRVLAPA